MLTDFQNPFTDRFISYLVAVKLRLANPSHLKLVVTLPCKTLISLSEN